MAENTIATISLIVWLTSYYPHLTPFSDSQGIVKEFWLSCQWHFIGFVIMMFFFFLLFSWFYFSCLRWRDVVVLGELPRNVRKYLISIVSMYFSVSADNVWNSPAYKNQMTRECKTWFFELKECYQLSE